MTGPETLWKKFWRKPPLMTKGGNLPACGGNEECEIRNAEKPN